MSVANPVIGSVDPSIKRIFLAPGVDEYHPITDIYAEVRYLRRTDENYRWFKMPVTAYGNVPKGGGKYTPRYLMFNFGWKVVPAAVAVLNVTGEQITDAGEAGPACMDPSLIPGGGSITIQYEPPAAEVIQVSTGSGLSQEEHDKLVGLPDDTLTTEEHDKLMGISPSGLTQAEHDQLMAAALEDTLADVETNLGSAIVARPTLAQIEGSTVIARQAELERALGLMQENFRLIPLAHDGDNNLTSGVIRLYSTAQDAILDQNPIAEYSVTASFDGPGKLAAPGYRVVRS